MVAASGLGLQMTLINGHHQTPNVDVNQVALITLVVAHTYMAMLVVPIRMMNVLQLQDAIAANGHGLPMTQLNGHLQMRCVDANQVALITQAMTLVAAPLTLMATLALRIRTRIAPL